MMKMFFLCVRTGHAAENLSIIHSFGASGSTSARVKSQGPTLPDSASSRSTDQGSTRQPERRNRQGSRRNAPHAAPRLACRNGEATAGMAAGTLSAFPLSSADSPLRRLPLRSSSCALAKAKINANASPLRKSPPPRARSGT
ncbi:MAG: hypothetical protein LBO00_09245 [Zoogloeaceae bacterium]|nr:hypothetical protein [Zoogloeaceae bacterium]